VGNEEVQLAICLTVSVWTSVHGVMTEKTIVLSGEEYVMTW
jgi:hypothetical protein